MPDDVRWKQRYANLQKSVESLEEGLQTSDPNKLERQGIIKSFELCYELAWKTLQDLLRELGFDEIVGPKPVIRQAFEAGLVSNGETWAAMHRARNESAHVYNESLAKKLLSEIDTDYASELRVLTNTLGERL